MVDNHKEVIERFHKRNPNYRKNYYLTVTKPKRDEYKKKIYEEIREKIKKGLFDKEQQ